VSSFFRVGVARKPRYTLKSSQATFQCHAGLSERVPGQLSPPECTGTVVALPSGCFRKTWLPRTRSTTKPSRWSTRTISFPLSRGSRVSYRDLLDSDQFRRACFAATGFKAEFNHFADAFHQNIEIFCLSVAALAAPEPRLRSSPPHPFSIKTVNLRFDLILIP